MKLSLITILLLVLFMGTTFGQDEHLRGAPEAEVEEFEDFDEDEEPTELMVSCFALLSYCFASRSRLTSQISHVRFQDPMDFEAELFGEDRDLLWCRRIGDYCNYHHYCCHGLKCRKNKCRRKYKGCGKHGGWCTKGSHCCYGYWCNYKYNRCRWGH